MKVVFSKCSSANHECPIPVPPFANGKIASGPRCKPRDGLLCAAGSLPFIAAVFQRGGASDQARWMRDWDLGNTRSEIRDPKARASRWRKWIFWRGHVEATVLAENSVAGVRHKLHVRFLSTGQNIPGDFRHASAEEISRINFPSKYRVFGPRRLIERGGRPTA
jgi:hypothetical protein